MISTKYRFAAVPLVAFSMLAAMSGADPAAAQYGDEDEYKPRWSDDRDQRDYYSRSWRGDRHERSLNTPSQSSTRDQAEETTPARPISTPLLALVSLKDQRVTIYDKDGPILHSPVSSGQTGYETPVGIYAILQKQAEHYSNVYDDAFMPHMQRITWSGIAFHGGALPGHPASHGCVRLPYSFAQRFFPMTKLGMRVIVSRYDVAPSPISHPLLFKPAPLADAPAVLAKTPEQVAPDEDRMKLGAPLPPAADVPPFAANRAAQLQAIIQQKTAEADEVAKKADALLVIAKQKSGERAQAIEALRTAEGAKKRAEQEVAYSDRDLSKATADDKKQKAQGDKDKAAAKLADATQRLEAAKAKFQPKIDDYEKAGGDAKAAGDARAALLAEAHDAQRKLSPASVFISRATQKLYVRQAFEPILEVPVTIRDPGQPIGTHIFTAVDYAEGNHDMRWNVASIGGRRPGDGDDEARNRRSDDYFDDDDDGRYRGRSEHRREQQQRSQASTPTDVGPTMAALDRITLAPYVVERISQLVLPGSSLIISDEPPHAETGKQTDFVVLISTEPQGGIKVRPKPRPEYYDDRYGGDARTGDDRRRRGREEFRGPFPFFQFW